MEYICFGGKIVDKIRSIASDFITCMEKRIK